MKPQRIPFSRRRRTSLILASLTAAALTSGLLVSTGAGAGPEGEQDAAKTELDRVSQPGTTKLVVVHARTRAERVRIVDLGVDATSKVTPRGLEVILHGAQDAQVLRDAGFTWSVKVKDLGKLVRANEREDAEYARTTRHSPLPSGRTSYRFLGEYNHEMTALSRRYPALVKPLTLPRRSVEGRRVRGIEITTQPHRVADGKPVFLLMGAHHAREWPSSEHALEYAYDLLQNYRRPGGDPRAKRIVANTRTIIVPVVNPDGFAVSRNAERILEHRQSGLHLRDRTRRVPPTVQDPRASSARPRRTTGSRSASVSSRPPHRCSMPPATRARSATTRTSTRSRLRSTGGAFEWDVNPSTRPLVAGRYGREPQAPPQDDVELTNPDGIPAVGESEETTFTVEACQRRTTPAPRSRSGGPVAATRWTSTGTCSSTTPRATRSPWPRHCTTRRRRCSWTRCPVSTPCW
jgi:hypothetical protein